MKTPLLLLYRFFFGVFWITLLPIGPIAGQPPYSVTNYTSREGLPQNSIRGLAFDAEGFLWLATEGGIARFDGRRFRIYDEKDHTGLNNQRFTHALKCNDSTILFMDQMNGYYQLTNNRFTTLQKPENTSNETKQITGAPFDLRQLVRGTPLFKAIHRRDFTAQAQNTAIFPAENGQYYCIGTGLLLMDLTNGTHQVLDDREFNGSHFAVLNQRLLWMNRDGALQRYDLNQRTFKPCQLYDENGRIFTEKLKDIRVFEQYPFTDAYLCDDRRLFKLEYTEDENRYVIRLVLNDLPFNTRVTEVVGRLSEGLIILGTMSKGIFIYQPQAFKTITSDDKEFAFTNIFYSHILLNDTALLTSKRLVIDPATGSEKYRFPWVFDQFNLGLDSRGRLYHNVNGALFRCRPDRPDSPPETVRNACTGSCMRRIGNTLWLGTTSGIARVAGDSLHWLYKRPFKQKQSLRSLCFDEKGSLWFSTKFLVYRMDTLSGKLDSFQLAKNSDYRELAMIRGKLFVGTYGNGYYVYEKNRFVHMPQGRNNALSHTHAFIDDGNGYLWLTTNRGLFKVQMEALEAYLRDSTGGLYYYTFREKDGILNTEFNGGCSPNYLRLPDGRLSLPTMEGLVWFHPTRVPIRFSNDSVRIEAVYDRNRAVVFNPAASVSLPSENGDIRVDFVYVWWGQPYNLQVDYMLKGIHDRFISCEEGQTSFTLGHLPPGKYELMIRKRSGFGPTDFVYSRLNILVKYPWYLQSWMLLLYAFGFLGLVWGYAAWNTRTVRARNAFLKQKVNEQTGALLQSNERLQQNLEKLTQSEENLRKNLRFKDRLISIITHDIVTPLRFIGLIARLGTDKEADDHGQGASKTLTDVHNAVEKLSLSAQNMLHWVKFQQEGFRPTISNCSPYVVVEQLFEDLSAMSRFQGTALVNLVQEDDVIRTDQHMLTIILHNLLTNAIKFTYQGEIRVSSLLDRNRYVLEVSDNGRGMTEQQLNDVRQGRMQNNTSVAGNGIGLTFVAELVEALQGNWSIESNAEGGVCARIFLPNESAKNL